MNKELLRTKAIKLEGFLSSYSKREAEASELFQMLSILIEDAKSMSVNDPMEWRDIPGGRLFSEGGLCAFSDLEQAFSEFRIEMTGGESPALKRLRDRRPDS